MASLRRTQSGSYMACFRFGGRQYQRALKTRDPEAAKGALGAIVNRVYKLTVGDVQVPEGMDMVEFIVWGDDASVRALPTPAKEEPEQKCSVAELIQQYLDDQEGLKAASTLGTERTHLSNLRKFLGPKIELPVERITEDDLNAFLRKREREAKGVTVHKERQTLRAFFKWAARKTRLPSSPAEELRMVQAGEDKAAFKTVEEVEEILQRGGLTDDDVNTLWESLYLTEDEIGEILETVEKKADLDFVHPMFAMPAYTGMRRGEIVRRLRWSDIGFTTKTITARSQKQSTQQKETSRTITMHPDLEKILLAYQKKRSRGQYVICHSGSLSPLTVSEAHARFQEVLRGTRWERTLPSGKKKIVIGFHTFRHSFASNLAAKGVDQRIIDRWMGHQTEEMRKRYQHLFPSKLGDAIRALSYNGNGDRLRGQKSA